MPTVSTGDSLIGRIFRSSWRSGWVLPGVLCIPAFVLLARAASWPWSDESYGELMHASGEFATRMLIIALLATPLQRIWPRARLVKWVRRRRRAFGVAAFAYALLHLGFYLAYTAPPMIIGDLTQWTYVMGWLAFLVMSPLAVTSTDGMVKRLGHRWRRLHRAAYVAAIAVCLHWLLKPDFDTLGPVLVHFTPLLLLQLNRVRVAMARRRSRRS